MNEVKNIQDGTKYTNSHWKKILGKSIIAIDFHHTITRTCEACDEFSGEYKLQEGVGEYIDLLAKDFTIVIFTGDPTELIKSGFLPKDYKKKIYKFLIENSIVFDQVLFSKPTCMFLIDDRAVHHKSWKETFEVIQERLTY